MDKTLVLAELQKINSALQALYAMANGIDPKKVEYVPPLMDGAGTLADIVQHNYRPQRSMSANEVYHLWVAAGRPNYTADGEAVDNRGAPMSWGGQSDNWHKYDKPAPAPTTRPSDPGPGDIDVPIEQG